MTREEAQEILLLHRDGRSVEGDAEMAEALRMAASDAELGKWLEEQRAFHARVAGEFSGIEPPAGLKARILAGVEGNRLKAGQHAERKAPRNAVWAAAAAVMSSALAQAERALRPSVCSSACSPVRSSVWTGVRVSAGVILCVNPTSSLR